MLYSFARMAPWIKEMINHNLKFFLNRIMLGFEKVEHTRAKTINKERIKVGQEVLLGHCKLWGVPSFFYGTSYAGVMLLVQLCRTLESQLEQKRLEHDELQKSYDIVQKGEDVDKQLNEQLAQLKETLRVKTEECSVIQLKCTELVSP